MANLTETEQWEAGIYQLETNDPVEGGQGGIDNLQAKQLGNRTAWLKAQLIQATESVLGLLKVGTQAQVDAGTNDTVAVTPKKLRYGFAASLTSIGYISFPSWLGGLVIQWGSLDGTSRLYYPIAFPTKCFVVVGNDYGSSNIVSIGSTLTTTYFDQLSNQTGKYIAIGV